MHGLRLHEEDRCGDRHENAGKDWLNEGAPGRNHADEQPADEPHRYAHQHAVAPLEKELRDHKWETEDDRSREHRLDQERDAEPQNAEAILLIAPVRVFAFALRAGFVEVVEFGPA